MTRKILIISAISLGVIILLLGGYYFFLKSGPKPKPAFDAIPPDAGMIITMKDPLVKTKTLFELPFWQGWDTITDVRRFHRSLDYLDSLIRTNERTRELTKGSELVISLHPGESGIETLYIMSLRMPTPDHFMDQFIQKANKDAKLEKIKTDYGEIRSIKTLRGADQFCYALNRGLFIAGMNFKRVESALQQLKSDDHWMKTEGFEWVRKSVNADKKMQVFFRMDNMASLWLPYCNDDALPFWNTVGQFAGWGGGAVNWNEEGYTFNGVLRSDSSRYFLNHFKSVEKPEENIAGRLPSNTLLFADYGWGEGAHVNYLDHSEHEIPERMDWGESLRSRVCFFMTYSGMGEYHSMAILDYNQVESKWSDFIIPMLHETDTFTFNDFPVVGIGTGTGPYNFPFSIFQQEDTLYSMLVDEYIIIADGVQALRDYAGKWVSGQTLDNQPDYAQWQKSVSNSGLITFFYRPSYGDKRLLPYLSESGMGRWNRNSTLWKLTPAAGVSITAKSGYYSFQFALTVASDFTQELPVEWEVPLASQPIIQPVYLSLPGDSSYYILTQDSGNTWYAMDQYGQMRWKRNLDSRITSAVHTVDFYEEGPQIVFSTMNFVYAMDREGKNLPGFPVEIPEGTERGMSYVKYSGEEGHRIFVPIVNNTILIWDKNGVPVEGWQAEAFSSSVILPIKHLKIGGKDYLGTFLKDGTVWVGDRLGRTVVNLEKTAADYNSPPVWVANNSLSTSALVYSNTDGVCKIVFLDENKQTDDHTTIPGGKLAAYLDSDKDGVKEFFVFNGQKLVKVDRKGEVKASYQFPLETSSMPFLEPLPGGYHILAHVSQEDKIYLLNNQLELSEGFPVLGSEFTSFFKTENPRNSLLVTNHGNKLLAYYLNFAD